MLCASLEAAATDHSSLAIGGCIQPLTPSLHRRGVPRDRGRAGNRGCLGSPGCHEESEARMLKVNWLTLSAPPAGLSKLLYPWPDPPIPLLQTAKPGRQNSPSERGEESEARMVKVNLLTLSASPAGLSKLLYSWPDLPIPLLLSAPPGRQNPPFERGARDTVIRLARIRQSRCAIAPPGRQNPPFERGAREFC